MADVEMYLNSGADPQVRSIQRLVNSFLRGEVDEGGEVLAMTEQFRMQYGYDPWTPLSDLIALPSKHH